jgi:hypothetical protein
MPRKPKSRKRPEPLLRPEHDQKEHVPKKLTGAHVQGTRSRTKARRLAGLFVCPKKVSRTANSALSHKVSGPVRLAPVS